MPSVQLPEDFGASKGIAWLGSRVATLLLAVLALTSVMSAYTIVAPGYTGVVFNIVSGSLRTVGQGLVVRIPWITRVQSYPTALRTYTMVMRSAEGSSPVDDSI